MSERPFRLGSRWSWLTGGVLAIGFASFFSDLGHEITTSLLPAFLVGALGAPALVLGLIEGIADGASALFKFWGATTPMLPRPPCVGGASWARAAIWSRPSSRP